MSRMSRGEPISEPSQLLVQRARSGDERALAELFEKHRERLRRTVQVRMNVHVQARVDASDVVQDAFLESARKLREYGEDGQIPFFVWLRMIACQRVAQLHRMHLRAGKRCAYRQVSLQAPDASLASAALLAGQLAGRFSSVDENLIRHELQMKLETALEAMEANDREVISMRHFEELTTEEMAASLGLTRSGVLKRYTRAIRRLRAAIGPDVDLTRGVA